MPALKRERVVFDVVLLLAVLLVAGRGSLWQLVAACGSLWQRWQRWQRWQTVAAVGKRWQPLACRWRLGRSRQHIRVRSRPRSRPTRLHVTSLALLGTSDYLT
jgi:hypothetical protein